MGHSSLGLHHGFFREIDPILTFDAHRPNVDKVLPEYLCAYTNMPHGKNQIDAQQRGVAQKHFNVGMYNELKLILPPLEEQKRFVDLLQQSDKSKCLLQEARRIYKNMWRKKDVYRG